MIHVLIRPRNKEDLSHTSMWTLFTELPYTPRHFFFGYFLVVWKNIRETMGQKHIKEGNLTYFINPCPLEVFFVTRPPMGGLLLQPLLGFSIRNAWYPYIYYQCIGIDLFYPLIPKWVPLNSIWHHCDIIKSARRWKFGCIENTHEN